MLSNNACLNDVGTGRIGIQENHHGTEKTQGSRRCFTLVFVPAFLAQNVGLILLSSKGANV